MSDADTKRAKKFMNKWHPLRPDRSYGTRSSSHNGTPWLTRGMVQIMYNDLCRMMEEARREKE